MFKVYMCYINDSKQLLESFDDNLKAIKFTFDLKEGLYSVKLTGNSQASHLLIEEENEKTERKNTCKKQKVLQGSY